MSSLVLRERSPQWKWKSEAPCPTPYVDTRALQLWIAMEHLAVEDELQGIRRADRESVTAANLDWSSPDVGQVSVCASARTKKRFACWLRTAGISSSPSTGWGTTGYQRPREMQHRRQA